MTTTRLFLLCGLFLCPLWSQEPISLFDGKTLKGWTSGDAAPQITGWAVEDGAIVTIPGVTTASDLVTEEVFGDFELTFSIRMSPNANSGIKYYINTGLRYLYVPQHKASSATGLEFQLAENNAPDCPAPVQKSGALYAILPPQQPVSTPAGEWIPIRLVCRNFACEHYIRGTKALSFDLKTADMQAKLRTAALDTSASLSSNFASIVLLHSLAANSSRGRIALQHHDTKVWFRDIKIRRF